MVLATDLLLLRHFVAVVFPEESPREEQMSRGFLQFPKKYLGRTCDHVFKKKPRIYLALHYHLLSQEAKRTRNIYFVGTQQPFTSIYPLTLLNELYLKE